MNTLVVVVALLAVGAVAEERGPRSEVFNGIVQECKKSSGATEADIKAFLSRQPPSSKAGWCLFGCIKKKTGVINAKNQLDIAKLKEVLSRVKGANNDMLTKFINVMTECKKQVEADPKNTADECTAAEAIGKCFASKKAAAGIL